MNEQDARWEHYEKEPELTGLQDFFQCDIFVINHLSFFILIGEYGVSTIGWSMDQILLLLPELRVSGGVVILYVAIHSIIVQGNCLGLGN